MGVDSSAAETQNTSTLDTQKDGIVKLYKIIHHGECGQKSMTCYIYSQYTFSIFHCFYKRSKTNV